MDKDVVFLHNFERRRFELEIKEQKSKESQTQNKYEVVDKARIIY